MPANLRVMLFFVIAVGKKSTGSDKLEGTKFRGRVKWAPEFPVFRLLPD
jgi:hypothetical protein